MRRSVWDRARKYGREQAPWYERWNREEPDPFTLEHMLANAWRKGFCAGQRHQSKIFKEKQEQDQNG